MKKLSLIFTIAAAAFMACNDNKSTTETTGTTQATSETTPAVGTTENDASQDPNALPIEIDPIVPGATAPVNPGNRTAATVSGANLNPAHGEPGHRCDIAVGAPLDSPPGDGKDPKPITIDPSGANNQTSPQIQMQPQSPQGQGGPQIQMQPQSGSQTPVTTAPGTNPPHGEPGHRCEIAVGAPLN